MLSATQSYERVEHVVCVHLEGVEAVADVHLVRMVLQDAVADWIAVLVVLDSVNVRVVEYVLVFSRDSVGFNREQIELHGIVELRVV